MKIILITGASEGIGASTARLAAEQGYIVCVNYRQNKAAADKVVEEIRDKDGEAFAFQADISDEAQVVRLFRQVDDRVGTLSSLVNNAGIIESQQKVAEMTAERLQKTFKTNVVGSFLCAREAIRRMSVKHGGRGGSIVNVSSMAARLGSPFEYVDYAATKGAIDTFTVGLAKEVAEENIRVNGVRPGTIYTEIHRKAGEANRAERVSESIPMKRPGQPGEVAKTILWLLSEEASYVTGALVDVAGGR